MIEIYKTLPNSDKIVQWLEEEIRKQLTTDISNYAKGRLRAWLGVEPSLTAKPEIKNGVQVEQIILDRLKELIEYNFDFCLVTYSGDNNPIGITPHRDASFANFEAMALHLSGECKFDYWMDRQEFGKSPTTQAFNPNIDKSTHSLNLNPGELVHFNCKNIHAASPSVKRWNINFWKKK